MYIYNIHNIYFRFYPILICFTFMVCMIRVIAHELHAGGGLVHSHRNILCVATGFVVASSAKKFQILKETCRQPMPLQRMQGAQAHCRSSSV